jgi:hypothetical protein
MTGALKTPRRTAEEVPVQLTGTNSPNEGIVMLKRHAALLTAILLVVGASGAFAATTDGGFPSLAQFLGLEDRVDALEGRVATLEEAAGITHPEPDEPGDPEEPGEPGAPQEPGDAQEPEHPHDPEEPNDPGEVDADVVLSGDYPEGVTIARGETALVDGLVTTPANVVVHGKLVMRPGSHLRFRDVDMTKYVGATSHDDHQQQILDSDVGLWVTAHGTLDIAGTPKQGWNRTGTHPSWQPGDEYWISPTEPGDYDPRRWKAGDAVPRFDSRVPAAEVMNVTRDVVIEGPAHIHINSHQPQRIEYLQLRSMGVSNAKHGGPVLGRYALHFHHGEEGTRGTIVRGVAAINSRGKVFVPHLSHGITFEDVVSVNSYAEAFWWDKGDKTHDVLVDGLAASGVAMPAAVAGVRSNIPVVTLKSNEGATIRNSAVSGSRGGSRALGFHWNTEKGHRFEHRAVWTFHDNVSHNNEGNGLRFWFNDRWGHHVRDSAVYNNGGYGIENGAYTNTIRYSGVLVLNNLSGGILHHSSTRDQAEDGGPSRYSDVTVEGPGPALEIGRLRGTPEARQEFVDCEFDGSPRVLLDASDKTANRFIALFRNCGDLTPNDLVFGGEGISSNMNGSSIIIEHADGRSWEVTVENGTKKVTAQR